MALKKGTYKYAVLKLKCPKCHEGDLFKKNKLFVFKGFLDMYDRCPKCNQDFIIEPGFYSAALWISYPIVLILLIPSIFLGLYSEGYFLYYIYPFIVLLLFAIQVPIMRLARAILLVITVRYENN